MVWAAGSVSPLPITRPRRSNAGASRSSARERASCGGSGRWCRGVPPLARSRPRDRALVLCCAACCRMKCAREGTYLPAAGHGQEAPAARARWRAHAQVAAAGGSFGQRRAARCAHPHSSRRPPLATAAAGVDGAGRRSAGVWWGRGGGGAVGGTMVTDGRAACAALHAPQLPCPTSAAAAAPAARSTGRQPGSFRLGGCCACRPRR